MAWRCTIQAAPGRAHFKDYMTLFLWGVGSTRARILCKLLPPRPDKHRHAWAACATVIEKLTFNVLPSTVIDTPVTGDCAGSISASIVALMKIDRNVVSDDAVQALEKIAEAGLGSGCPLHPCIARRGLRTDS